MSSKQQPEGAIQSPNAVGENLCPVCNSPTNPGESICRNCGAALPQAAKRAAPNEVTPKIAKMITIVALSVVLGASVLLEVYSFYFLDKFLIFHTVVSYYPWSFLTVYTNVVSFQKAFLLGMLIPDAAFSAAAGYLFFYVIPSYKHL